MGSVGGQTAVVTGASGALGRALVTRLLASGAEVVGVGRAQRRLSRAAREAGWNLEAVHCLTADLAVEAEVNDLVRTIRDRCPHVHILIHAAGCIAVHSFERGAVGHLDRQYLVNVRAPFQLTRGLLPKLSTDRGFVVFVNSSAGMSGRPRLSQYSATKHALKGLADSLREEVNERGVRVLSVFVGRMAGRMQACVCEREGRTYAPDTLLQADDVASLIVHALQLSPTAEVTDLHVRPAIRSLTSGGSRACLASTC